MELVKGETLQNAMPSMSASEKREAGLIQRETSRCFDNLTWQRHRDEQNCGVKYPMVARTFQVGELLQLTNQLAFVLPTTNVS